MPGGIKRIIFGLILFVDCFLLATLIEQPIVVIVPSYHNAHIYKKNLDWIFNQNYSNYRIIYIADGDLMPDSDSTGVLVEQYVKEKGQEHRFNLIRNRDRHFALNNTYRAVLSCSDDEIFVILDGDDAFAHADVLKRVNQMHSQPNKEVWYTYGDFKAFSGTMASWTSPIPEWALVENRIRQWPHMATHLRTCRAWLAKQIKIEDFFYNGYFFTMTGDVALFEPIMEMAGRRYHMTREVLYDYNDMNVLNDHVVDKKLQSNINTYIRRKKSYQKLPESMSGQLDALKKAGALTADLIVFSDNNADQLCEFLTRADQIKNIKTVSVFYKTHDSCSGQYDELMQEFSACRFINRSDSAREFAQQLLSALRALPSTYVLCARDLLLPDDTIDIEESLYWLELTHAHAFYLNLSRPFFDTLHSKTNRKPVQLNLMSLNGRDIFAWQYSRVLAPFAPILDMTLLRKADLISIVENRTVDGPDMLEHMWQQSVHDNQVGLFYRQL